MARVKQTGGRAGRKDRIQQTLPKMSKQMLPKPSRGPKKPKKSSRRGRQSGVKGASIRGLDQLFRSIFGPGGTGSKFSRGKGRTKAKRTSRGKNRAANTGRLSGVGSSKPRPLLRPKARGSKKPARTYRKPLNTIRR